MQKSVDGIPAVLINILIPVSVIHLDIAFMFIKIFFVRKLI
jgi:hypothetical protein